MQYRVGDDVSNYCGKCKQRTYHVVFAMEGTKVKRVQCKICLSYHNYHPEPELETEGTDGDGSGVRRRRDGIEQDLSPKRKAAKEPSKRKAASSRATPRGSRAPAEPDWTELWEKELHGKDLENLIDYDPKADYQEASVLHHPKFGVGIITRVMPRPEKRMYVLFRDGNKTLICRFGS